MAEETVDDKDTAPETEPRRARQRRRASRAAGPAGSVVTIAASASAAPAREPDAAAPTVRITNRVTAPPRRSANTRLTATLAVTGLSAAVLVAGAAVAVLGVQHRHNQAAAARDQRFVAAAEQTVINMFSYTDQTVEESVDRFVAGTSGPLRDMMASNAENLKALFRATQIATSEVVINGAALESVDEEIDNASVLVATRVTTTDLEGITKPSMPYRIRVIVHEDDAGNMTGYDVRYPEGGN